MSSSQTVGKLGDWLKRCEGGIPAKNSRQPNLFPAFPGSTVLGPFRCSFDVGARHVRTLSPSKISRIVSEPDEDIAIALAVEVFANEVPSAARDSDAARRRTDHPLHSRQRRLLPRYPGLYVPNPLVLHAQRRDTPDWNLLLKETLALTKMNWNGTQFDGALPITLKAARQVGDILQYVPDGITPDPRCRFYM